MVVTELPFRARAPVPVVKLNKALVPPTAAAKVCVPVVVKLKLRAVESEFKVLAKLIEPALLAVKLVFAPRVTAPL